jgi:hypothetical protein
MFARMATRQVIISDLSGKDVDEQEHVRLVITEHPLLGRGSAELDISKSEADRFQSASIELVHAEVHAPNEPRRHVVMLAEQFNAQFTDMDVVEVLGRAVRVPEARVSSTRGTRQTSGRKPAGGAKREYSSPDFAGVEHRGRVTEAEANFVRNNLAAANANRAREGQDPIDPKNEKYKKRYGFK